MMKDLLSPITEAELQRHAPARQLRRRPSFVDHACTLAVSERNSDRVRQGPMV